MAIFNLSALADRTRYLESQGMSYQEAEKQAFQESSFKVDQMSNEMYNEFQRLYNNEHSQTLLNGNLQGDKDRLIDRNNAGMNEKYDLNPQEQTAQRQTAQQQTTQKTTTQEPTKATKQNKE